MEMNLRHGILGVSIGQVRLKQ